MTQLQQPSDSGSLGVTLVSSVLVAMKDSRALQLQDRQRLVEAIRICECRRVMVPHGTYTMAETGRYLQEVLADLLEERLVVLVGSLVPLGEEGSEAEGSLEVAVEELRRGEGGVRLVMGGEVWRPEGVEKDPETGRFREIQ